MDYLTSLTLTKLQTKKSERYMKLETPWYTNATFLDAIYICELELEQVYYMLKRRAKYLDEQ